jgi:hypothetical protein
MIVRSDSDPNIYRWTSLDSGGYGGPSVLPADAEEGPKPKPMGFLVVARKKQPAEDRLTFLRRRVDEIKGRGYTRSDEVNNLAHWLDEALTLLGKPSGVQTEEGSE